MLNGEMATGLNIIQIEYRIYEKVETVKEIIQKIMSMNNADLNSTYNDKDISQNKETNGNLSHVKIRSPIF